MLTEELITQMKSLRNDEDNSLWKQGDLMRDHALSKAEMKKLAEILQLKVSTLNNRRMVSIETPEDKRKKEYAWSIYSKFAMIDEPVIRWQLMFSRPSWTIDEATKVVQQQKRPTVQVKPATSKYMIIDDIRIGAKLDDAGKLTVTVSLGSSYDVDVDQNDRKSIIVFTP